ncbi:MAG: hypothetical protein K8L97_31775 [Anaerolineae bacterium]|nr:hypothetical protein [Anaerolineae bacterium]
MNTSAEAIRLLQEALTDAQAATKVIDDLIVEHQYQDVALLVAHAAATLLQSATLLMQSKDEDALTALEQADDFLDEVYAIIDGETDED